jgi:hypothetical protein
METRPNLADCVRPSVTAPFVFTPVDHGQGFT